jgi:archaellum component FlaC
MKGHKSTVNEIENALKEIGEKIDQLIKKGTEVRGEVREEIEKKIEELKENKTMLEQEFRKAKDLIEHEFQEKREDLEPRLKESKSFFKEGIRQLGLALKALLGKN